MWLAQTFSAFLMGRVCALRCGRITGVGKRLWLVWKCFCRLHLYSTVSPVRSRASASRSTLAGWRVVCVSGPCVCDCSPAISSCVLCEDELSRLPWSLQATRVCHRSKCDNDNTGVVGENTGVCFIYALLWGRRLGVALLSAMLAAVAASLPPWREDGRCGLGVTAPDGTRPSRCDPANPRGLTCCSAAGFCVAPAAGSSGCSCSGCIEYALRKPWRDDGQCGPDLSGADGSRPAACNPMDPRNLTCCSDMGWCGPTHSWEHCLCKSCVNHYSACVCLDDAQPCQDPTRAICYPRTERAAAATETGEASGRGPPQHDSLGRAMDEAHLASAHDRRPELDPRQSMRTVELNRQLSRSHTVGQPSVGVRRPTGEVAAAAAGQLTGGGLRCARGLVDCLASRQSAVPRAVTDSEAMGRNASTATVATTASADVSVRTPRVATAAEGGGAAATTTEATEADGTDPLDVGASAAQTDGARPTMEKVQLRLSGMAATGSGRLEILFDGVWGTVCDEGWSWEAAHVSCRRLGYASAEGFAKAAAYGVGSGPVWLSHVSCTGSESRLEECAFFGLNASSLPPGCDHTHDVGLSCSRHAISAHAISGPLGDARPEGGNTPASPWRQRYRPVGFGTAGSGSSPPSLRQALDQLEAAISDLEATRFSISDAEIARMSRLRRKLLRLSGRPVESCTLPAEGDAGERGSARREGGDRSGTGGSTGAAAEAEAASPAGGGGATGGERGGGGRGGGGNWRWWE